MIINFNDKSNTNNDFSYWHMCRNGSWGDNWLEGQHWFVKHLMDFRRYHDLAFNKETWAYITSQAGIRKFVSWMHKQGWSIKYWEIESNDEVIAYGIELDPSCPVWTELKLKS